MAKVKNNIFLRGLSGSVGKQFVIRKTKSGKTIIANIPTFDENREFSEPQVTQQGNFRSAVVYAKQAQHDPYYQEKALGTDLSAYNIAIRDFSKKPEVLSIDADRWHGQVGQQIYIRAMDDCRVTGVRLVIRPNSDDYDSLDGGQAVQSETDGLLWIFTATKAVQVLPGMLVDVTAYDLPGNTGTDSVVID